MMVTRRQANSGILASAALAAMPALAGTQELKPIELPPPRSEGGMPLINALKLRHSTREFSDRALPPQTLSDLLWAAFGINRPNGFRTAPCARYIIAIDIYLAMADGVWIFDKTAPLNLVYVAHGERLLDNPPEERRLLTSVDTGFIGQNVYLFCASEGLVTVFRGSVDHSKLKRTLKLPHQQFVTFAQTVGYPRAA
jgi:hypothetical protein